MMHECEYVYAVLDHRSANFFYRGPENKYFQLGNCIVSVATT